MEFDLDYIKDFIPKVFPVRERTPQAGVANLQCLNWSIPMKEDYALHIDGSVEYPVNYSLSLAFHYGIEVEEVDIMHSLLEGLLGWDLAEEFTAAGVCFEGPGHVHIFYKNRRSRNLNINAQGHEEYHAAELIHREGADEVKRLLSRELLLKGVDVDLTDIPDNEIRARIAGMYAMMNVGIDPLVVKDDPYFQTDRESHDTRALDIFVAGTR